MAVLIVLLAFVLSVGLTRALLYTGSYLRILDQLNACSFHDTPVPHTDEIAIVTSMFVGLPAVVLVIHSSAGGPGALFGVALLIDAVIVLFGAGGFGQMMRTDVRLEKVALPRRIRRELGWRPARTLRDALPEMVAAYRGRA